MDVAYAITKKWTIKNSFDDMTAQFFKSKGFFWNIANMFGKNKGPHELPTLRGDSKVWNDIVNSHREKSLVKKAASVGADHTDAFTTPTKEAKAEQIKAIRMKLSEKKEETESRKRAKLD